MQVIDSHVHVGLKEFCTNPNTAFKYDLSNSYHDFVRLMDESGVERAVILPIPHVDFDASKSNDYLFEAYQTFPDRLIPFCRLDDKLEMNFERGFKGAKVHMVYEELPIKQIKQALLFLESIQAPIIIHALFNDKVGQVKQILKIAPNLNIILAHMGRGHIYTDEQIIENVTALKKYDNVYFETSTIGSAAVIKESCNIVGDGRIIYGSDYPFGRTWFDGEKEYKYRQEIDLFDHLDLSRSSIEKILYKNIYDLLDVEEDPGRIIIRKVKKDDLEQVTNLIHVLDAQDIKFLALEQKLLLIKQQIKNERHCFVSIIDGQIVGFMRESGRPEGYALLEEVLVHPDFRGRGIAQEMLTYFHRIYAKTLAKTNAKNEKMINLLKKTGYTTSQPDAQRIINWTRCDE